MELLEDRTLLSTITYDSGFQNLTFEADLAEADDVTVSSTAANQLTIQVGGGDAIELAGDAIGNTDFVLSTIQNFVCSFDSFL